MNSITSPLFRAISKPSYFSRFGQICYYSTPGDKEAQTYHRPKSATRLQYESSIKDERVRRIVVDEHSGVKITGVKRFFLVATGLYKKMSEVPEYVPSAIINRLGDRLRVVFIITFILIFFTIFYVSELLTVRKIEKDRFGQSK